MSDHDRRDDSQSGAGRTARQLIVPLYFQRAPGRGTQVVQRGSTHARD
jgi:hypothetical protein